MTAVVYAGLAIAAFVLWRQHKSRAEAVAGTRTSGVGSAMGGYVALLVVVTALAVVLRELSIVDLPSFVVTIAVAHLGLLFWELPRIGLTLGAPGLKPRPLSKSPEHRTRKESR